jgi:hypothetical protein
VARMADHSKAKYGLPGDQFQQGCLCFAHTLVDSSIAKSMTRCCSEKLRRASTGKEPKPSPIVHSRRGELASRTDKAAVLNFMQKLVCR